MLKAVILGIVQGITEWLPVSSTGHLILVEQFVKFNLTDVFVSTFMVVIQLGSILAVLTLYFRKLNPLDNSKTEKEKRATIDLWLKVIVAVIPSAILGFLFDDAIDALFFNPTTVSITLILYGVIMIILENRNKKPIVSDFSQLTYKLAIGIGIFQCLALIPGTSRS
ncbi:MAG: undecaprenyl-diphosphate phosphatase, partial [Paeniclostridium sordellii]|nr:undecaprenyl-diphosphate phosphatase [Paeniclostridium sordellii]